MDIYLKAVAGILITVLLCLCVSNRSKEIGVLLALLVCAMVVSVAFSYLQTVFQFYEQLQQVIGLDNDLLHILLKAVGVGLLGEIAGAICADGGQATLGKGIQILTAAVILWIALPLYTQILSIVEELLKGI